STLIGASYAAVLSVLLDDARRLRRFAVIDAPLSADVAEVLRLRRGFDSSFGALYWPALSCAQCSDGRTPASGAVCGAYALSDQERGVFRSAGSLLLPSAGAPVAQATSSELADLDAAGINVIRALPGIGVRVSGAHTLSFDRELRSLTVRRHLLFLQNSIARGTRWTVHERNDARLWQELRTRIAEFLRWQFLDGAFMGSQAAEAYYVHCDESTVSADDRTAGLVVCEIGVALLRAAEFITFRVAQRTARL
ncbi:MAG TPA: phage tail sheath C-terminal domain-containing protein, partial [Burkholderiaceae bacterium]|nr:phage tail sheath C-terminal domain-containing protein [Burkholderiaceae bacterium]